MAVAVVKLQNLYLVYLISAHGATESDTVGFNLNSLLECDLVLSLICCDLFPSNNLRRARFINKDCVAVSFGECLHRCHVGIRISVRVCSKLSRSEMETPLQITHSVHLKN